MAGPGDYLAQAFGNIPQTSGGALAQGFASASPIIDTALKAQAMLDAKQQAIAANQAKLQEVYLGKGSELLTKATDDKVPTSVRENMIGAASEMFSRGGIGGFSDDFKQMFKDSPELRQAMTAAQLAYQDTLVSPADPQKRQALASAIQATMQMSSADYPQIMRQLDESNKNFAHVLGQTQQGKGLDNSATLDRYKQGLDAIKEVAGFRSVKNPLQTVINNPSTGQPFLDAAGNPATFGTVQNKLAQIQKGSLTPSTQDNQLFEAAQSTYGQLKSGENEFQEAVKRIDQGKAELMKASTAGMSADQKKDLAYIRKTPINADNWRDLDAKIQGITTGAATTQDVTQRGRQLSDKALQIKEGVVQDLGKAQKEEAKLNSLANEFLKNISTNTTINEVNERLRALTGVVDTAQRVTESEVGRQLNKTYLQNIQQLGYRLTGEGGAKLTPDQVQIIRNSINSVKESSNNAQATMLHNQYKNLDQYKNELGGRMDPTRAYLAKEIGSHTTRPTPALIESAYSLAGQKLPANATEEDKQNYVVESLKAAGKNPLVVEQYFKAKKRK